MEQYILKSEVVAEIEKRIKVQNEDRDFNYLQIKELESLLYFLDAIEMKEVDLEKEYKDFVEEDPVYNKLVNSIVGKAIAKHFFELGFNARKEE